MSEKKNPLAEIQYHREQIDEIDRQIIVLLNQRAAHSLVIRDLKPLVHQGLCDPRREEEIFEKMDDYNEGPLYNEHLRDIFTAILQVMKGMPSS